MANNNPLSPSISEPPTKETSSLLVFLLILSILILIIIGILSAHAAGFISLPFLSGNNTLNQRQALINPTPTTVSEREEALERDQIRLDDIEMILTSIKEYKENGEGEGVYYPRNLMHAIPQSHKERIFFNIDEGQYGYKQIENGTNFRLIVKLETAEAVNKHALASVGQREVLFHKESVAYQQIDVSSD